MKALLSFTLIAWFLGVLFMLNRAQANYCGVFTSQEYNNMLAAGIPIVAFDHYSYSPEISKGFPYLRDSLTDLLQSGERLRITGHYTSTESKTDKNLGLKRANSLRMLFLDYINPDHIEIDSKLSNTVSQAPIFEVINDHTAKLSLGASDLPMMMDGVSTDEAVPANPEGVGEVTFPQTQEETVSEPMVDKPKEVKTEVAEEVIIDKPKNAIVPARSNEADYVIYFKDKSSDFIGQKEVQQYLNALGMRLKKSKEKIEVIGYDDNSRSNEESLALAKRRTWRVRKGFSDNFVRRKLVKIKNKGQIDPVAENDTEDGRSQNRRVEIRILKK